MFVFLKHIHVFLNCGTYAEWKVKILCSVHLLQFVCRRAHVLFTLFVFVCVCLCTVVFNTSCVVLLFCFSSSCVPYVANCSGFSNFYWSFGILERLFYLSWNILNIINPCRPTEYLICIFVFCLTKLNQQISMSSPLTESFNLEPWSPGNTCLFTGRLPLQSVHITTKVVSSNPAQAMCTRYNVMW